MGKTIAVIGLGLIGGSLAIDLKRCGFADKIMGVDNNDAHRKQAMELGFVDEIADWKTALWQSDLVILAIPVDALIKLLPLLLDEVSKNTVITDVGSTKAPVANCIKDHPKRERFVASHPMSGTEFSGPTAAVKNLFQEKAAIICNKKESAPDALILVEQMYKSLYMDLEYMDAVEHDVHAAYVSHISHISSFVLAATVLEKEKSAENIFTLASGGFQSTVRLAKSSPEMWAPIFLQNQENMLTVLNTYIQQMEEFKQLIANKDEVGLKKYMEEANKIKKALR